MRSLCDSLPILCGLCGLHIQQVCEGRTLSEASTFIEVIEKRQGLKIACLEGIALRQGWINSDKMKKLAQPMSKNQYGQYLLKVIDELAADQ